jgi:hypothetical protein
MSRLTELVAKLTSDQLQEVEDFAEFLATRPRPAGPGTPRHSKPIDVDALVGLCKGMGGDKTDKELIREAWDDLLDKYER